MDRLITALDRLRTRGPARTYTPDHRPSPETRPLQAWARSGASSIASLGSPRK